MDISRNEKRGPSHFALPVGCWLLYVLFVGWMLGWLDGWTAGAWSNYNYTCTTEGVKDEAGVEWGKQRSRRVPLQ